MHRLVLPDDGGVGSRSGAEAPRSLWFNAPETDEGLRRTLTLERVVAEALTLMLGDHPGIAGLLKTRDPLGPHSLALAEAFLLPLHHAGFPHREAGHAFFLILDYTLGLEVSSTRISVNEQRVKAAATRKRLHEFFRSLPDDRFPTLIALGEHVWLDNRDERFAAGINALLDGLERAQRPASPPK